MQTSTGTAVRTDPMGRVTRTCRASPAADATAALPQPQRARQVRTRWWQGALTPRQSLVPHQVCATGRTPAKRLRPQAGTQKKKPRGRDGNVLDNHGDGRGVDKAAIRWGKHRRRDRRARQGRPAARRADVVAATTTDHWPRPLATRPGSDSCRLKSIPIVIFQAYHNCT